ncbi:lanthionine synthetase C family protein [Spongiimicrobium sp. 3-5]|uniref:lanthionine synthetase C family protein n=1 Tax=Spongiimicrobium sp. 3-5 TaxID=3332596 RepID=UPI0039802B72
MEKRQILEQQLEEINHILSEKYEKNEQIGVLSGISGIALFKFYYSKYKNNNTHADVGLEMLTEAVGRINNGYVYPTYCVGIAGAGWVMEHLLEEDLFENDNDELLEGLDDYLYKRMIADIKIGNFDFLHGAIGYGFFFLKRLRNTKKPDLKKRYKEFIDELIDHLISTAIKEDNMLKWASNLQHTRTNKGYNLSLSHGIPSILNFLAKVRKLELFNDKIDPLLEGSINYILNFKVETQEDVSLFPSVIEKGKSIEYNSRLAWCYGDLGIGLTLWQVSTIKGYEKWKSEALQILKHAAKRRSPESSKVIDAAVCHGSYGNAQIFNTMYKNTGDPLFKETALFWIDDGISKAKYKDGYAGYKQWNGEEEAWKCDISLLEGVAGIGLTIIDHLANFDTRWDECLMIS